MATIPRLKRFKDKTPGCQYEFVMVDMNTGWYRYYWDKNDPSDDEGTVGLSVIRMLIERRVFVELSAGPVIQKFDPNIFGA